MSAEKDDTPVEKPRRSTSAKLAAQQRRERILTAVLGCPTIVSAATHAGVSERTVRRLLAKPDFQERLAECRRQMFAATVGRLMAAAGLAVETLRRAMTCGQPSVEVRAAQTVLSAAIDGERFRLELGELADLRQQVAELTRLEAERKEG